MWNYRIYSNCIKPFSPLSAVSGIPGVPDGTARHDVPYLPGSLVVEGPGGLAEAPHEEGGVSGLPLRSDNRHGAVHNKRRLAQLGVVTGAGVDAAGYSVHFQPELEWS